MDRTQHPEMSDAMGWPVLILLNTCAETFTAVDNSKKEDRTTKCATTKQICTSTTGPRIGKAFHPHRKG